MRPGRNGRNGGAAELRINQSESKASARRQVGLLPWMKSSIFRAEPKWAATNFHRSSVAAACQPDPASQECKAMRLVLGAMAMSAALVATDASAQGSI